MVEAMEKRVFLSVSEMRGVNDLSAYGFDTNSFASNGGDMKTWGVDIVRQDIPYFDQIPLGTSGATIGGSYLQGLQAIVNNDTSNLNGPAITVLCPFSWNGSAILGDTPSSTSFWSTFNSRLKAEGQQFAGNKNVWLETWNEPYTTNSPSTWTSDMESMITSIRNGGFTGPIVIPGSNYGGDEAPILSSGQALVSYDPSHNLVFDLHAYSSWIYGQTAAQMESRMSTILAKNVNLMFGEFGPGEPGESGLENPNQFITAAEHEGVTALAWHWNDSDASTLHNSDGTLNNTSGNYDWANQVISYVGGKPAVSGLPSGWTDTNINSPAYPGTTNNTSAGAYTVTGEGDNITGNSDQFNFAAGGATGNHTMVARITSVQNTASGAQAGVMFRDTDAISSLFAMVDVTPSGVVQFDSRNTTGGTGTITASSSTGITPSAATPIWVKLVKSGTSYTAFYSTSIGSPGSWTQVGSAQTISFTQGTYQAGLAVCSWNTSELASALFDDVNLS